MPEYFIGLMSGTSLDGVDGVIATLDAGKPRVLRDASAPLPDALRNELMALNSSGADELHRAWLAGNELMRVYAAVVRQLLGTDIPPEQVAAIGAHGQTVRHRPQQFDGTGYTIQLAQPALLAELTGIDVVADFRSRDVAAGGQGAPLAPFFHQAMFGGETPVGVLNIGGIANLSILRPGAPVAGFDCGPGNALLDHWCVHHTGQPYDAGGAWAAKGQVDQALLQRMLAEPYFDLPPPKSTGRDLFNPPWLRQHLEHAPDTSPRDVQATLTELTARSIANDVARHAPGVTSLVVCGGGALNTHLVQRLQALLPAATVTTSDAQGLPPLQVEALAFAWLARKAVRRENLDLQSTTGAQGARVLGAIYPR